MAVVKAPTIPDAVKLEAVAELCSIADPYATGDALDALFLRAMREIIAWHAEHSAFYRRVLANAGFSALELRTPGDWAAIPFIPANFFKSHELLSIPREAVEIELTSSGTTGQKSKMFFDRWSIRAPQRMVEFHFDRESWSTPKEKVNYLLSTYEVEPDSKLGTAYTDNFLCGFAAANRVEFLLKRTGSGTHEFDIFGAIRALEAFAAEKLPVRIFGFPAFLYFVVKRMRALGIKPLKLNSDSLVFFGGGWKGHANQAIHPETLYAMISETLGIALERIRDGFGSVEHCVPYMECRKHRFHVPVWSRVLIRDVRTLQALPYGQPGFLQFISPYITSAPAHSILMGDLAQAFPGNTCGCGIATPWFEVLGRAGVSKNKSCAITAAELLRGIS